MSNKDLQALKSCPEAQRTFINQFTTANLNPDSRFYPTNSDKSPDTDSWGEKQGSHPTEIESPNMLGRTGRGWACLDIDHAEDTPKQVIEFIENNPTFHVRTPHSDHPIEGHHHYQIPEYTGKNNFEWGELKYRTLTMVPGSKITECKYGCCTQSNPGKYDIGTNRKFLQITQAGLPEIFDRETNTSETVSGKDTVLSESFGTHPTETEAPEFNPQERLQYGRIHSETLDELCGWASQNGNPEEIGYSGRSEAERALSMCLAYWYERNTTAVRHTLNILNPPKWAQRDDDYKDSVLEAIELQPDTFDQIDTGPSGPSEELTLSVWLDLFTHESMSTKEVAESVEYGERQTRKALNWLDDNGYINYERDGRSSRWVVNEESQDPLDEAENELNSIESMEQYLK